MLADAITESYQQALDLAADETGLTAALFPPDCPYNQAQVLARDYYPPSE